MKGGDGSWIISCLRNVTLQKYSLDWLNLWELGHPSWWGVVDRPCEVSWELVEISGQECVAPLRLGGLRGKKSTPSIGWEVLVKSRRLVGGSCTEHAGRHSEWAIRQRYDFFICMINSFITFSWICIFTWVSDWLSRWFSKIFLA
jgi:hypothetical protein